jgi:hypothetical protein
LGAVVVVLVVVVVVFAVVVVVFAVVGTVVTTDAGAVVVVVAVAFALTIASIVACWGALGVTPWGSKAIVTRRNCVSLIDEGFVVTTGFF